jgi:Flp pilus assembly protein TadB
MHNRAYKPRVPDNPLLQLLALLAAGIFAVGAVLLGAVLLSLFLGVAVIAGLVLYIRLWWLRRKLQKRGTKSENHRPGEFVEVEYTVVRERPASDDESTGRR